MDQHAHVLDRVARQEHCRADQRGKVLISSGRAAQRGEVDSDNAGAAPIQHQLEVGVVLVLVNDNAAHTDGRHRGNGTIGRNRQQGRIAPQVAIERATQAHLRRQGLVGDFVGQQRPRKRHHALPWGKAHDLTAFSGAVEVGIGCCQVLKRGREADDGVQGVLAAPSHHGGDAVGPTGQGRVNPDQGKLHFQRRVIGQDQRGRCQVNHLATRQALHAHSKRLVAFKPCVVDERHREGQLVLIGGNHQLLQHLGEIQPRLRRATAAAEIERDGPIAGPGHAQGKRRQARALVHDDEVVAEPNDGVVGPDGH